MSVADTETTKSAALVISEPGRHAVMGWRKSWFYGVQPGR